jgi:GNAT superfamily N-acetyltransferase
MKVMIREYKESDYAACVALYGELAQHYAKIFNTPAIAAGDPGVNFNKYLSLDNRCGAWVAEVDAKIVGFTGLIENQIQEYVVAVEPLVVSTAFRSQGIGSKLVAYVKKEAKKKGYRFLTIRPDLRNKEAFKLYVQLGFDMVGEVELFQDLMPERGRTWKSGVEILGQKLRY